MDIAENRARLFVAVFAVATTFGFWVYRSNSVAARLVSLDENLRAEAADDLKGLRPAQKVKLVPDLVKALKSREPNVRYLAACALGELGPAGLSAAPALLGMLGDTGMDSNVGMAAGTAFARISPDPVPGLLVVLKDGDVEARRSAACAMANLGPAAPAAQALLQEAAKDADSGLKECARRSLGYRRR